MRLLLLSAFFMTSAMAVTSMADNRIYFYENDGDLAYGHMRRVSDNGRWAVACDDGYWTGSFIVDLDEPEAYEHVMGELYDITDDGMAVGAWYDQQGTVGEPVYYAHAAFYADGEWTRLEEPASIFGRSYAMAVSPDGKFIAGIAMCHREESEIGGKYFPLLWTRNEAGEYDLKTYNDIKIPNNYGFFVTDMSADGKTLVGYVFTGWGNTVAAMLIDGEVKLFNKLEERLEKVEYEYNGKIYTTEYERSYLDGVLEEKYDMVDARFNYIRGNYAYGNRVVTTNVDLEEATGTFNTVACIYDLENDTLVDSDKVTFFSCGDGMSPMFGSESDWYGATAYYFNNGRQFDLEDWSGVDLPEGVMSLAAVYSIDNDAQIVTGSGIWFNDLIGVMAETPFLLMLDKPLISGIEGVSADNATAKGDDSVYDLCGRRCNPDRLAPGIYIRGGKKFIVR